MATGRTELAIDLPNMAVLASLLTPVLFQKMGDPGSVSTMLAFTGHTTMSYIGQLPTLKEYDGPSHTLDVLWSSLQ
ncbi:hypothetical protein EOD39_21087 [Acipenser ruthenus]|uniref:Uncharacterized protein n=1 Tax=Acipenser ruthenus TaxID=7906 RepID=A0A444UTQ6_ACIRT|nr:hypothetical protein EOD39_21087 [Acipenser ruthenus]